MLVITILLNIMRNYGQTQRRASLPIAKKYIPPPPSLQIHIEWKEVRDRGRIVQRNIGYSLHHKFKELTTNENKITIPMMSVIYYAILKFEVRLGKIELTTVSHLHQHWPTYLSPWDHGEKKHQQPHVPVQYLQYS